MQYPYDPYQIGALVFFCAIVACCYGLQVPVIQDKGKQTALVVIYTVLVFIGFFLNFLTSWLDPSDPGLDGAGNGDFYCSLCEASVGRSSKHCKACDRCVEGFDHHCKWLNNCIGKRNYKPFVVLVSGTLSACIVQFAWLLWLIVRSFEDEEVLRPSLQESYGGDVNYIGWQVFLFIYLVLLLAAIIMVGELFSFHVVLISKGLTTYEYILSQREKQAFEDGKSGMAESMDTAKGVFKCLCCCKQNRVQDESQAAPRARPKVGLNPCAALTATKPEHLSFASGIGKHAGKEDASPHAIAKAADEAFGRKDSHSTGSPAHHFTVSNGFTNGTNPLSVGGSPVSEHRLPSRAPSPLDASSIHQPPNFSALRALPPQSLQQGTRMHALHGPGYGHSYGQGVGQGQRGVQSHSPLGGYGQGMGQGQPQGSLQRYQQKWDVGGVQSLSPLGAGVGADPVSVQRQQQQQRQQQATQLTQQQAAQAEQQLQLLEQTRQQQLRQQQHTHVHAPPSPSYPHPAFTPDMHEHESLQPSLADDLHAGSLTPHPQQHALPTSLTHSSHPTATPPPRSRVAPLPPIHTPASTNTQSSFATSPTQPPTSTHELRDSASIRGSDPRFNPDPWAQQGQCQGPDVCVDQGRHPSGGGPGPHSYSSAQPSAWSRLYPSYDPELAQNSPGVS